MDAARSDEVKRLLDALDAVRDPAAEARGGARIAAVYAGQEADCLPILFDAPAHDVAVQADLHEQFYFPEAMLAAHLKRMVATAAVPQDGQLCIRPNFGVVFVPSVSGLEPEVPSDAMPRFRSHLGEAQIRHFHLPEDVARCNLVARAIDYAGHFRQALGGRAHVYMPDTQGVFDIAHLVLGNALFYALYDQPEFAHHLLELCLQAYLDVTMVLKRALDEPLDGGYHGHGMVSGLCLARGGARASEDTPTLLRPEHIDEFVVPYIARSLRPFGGGFVHYCGRNDHLFEALLAMPEVRGINLGNPEKHDPQSYMQALLAHDKFYFGFWPRRPGEGLRDYLQRMLDLASGRRKGLIFLLTPQELGTGSPAEAVRLWRELQQA